MRRTPGIVVIEPGIRTGLDRHKTVVAVLVSERASRTAEIWIEWRGVLIALMLVSSRGVCLPYLDQRIRDGPAVVIEHTAGHDDALPQRFRRMLAREIVIGFADWVVSVDGPGDFRKRVRKKD